LSRKSSNKSTDGSVLGEDIQLADAMINSIRYRIAPNLYRLVFLICRASIPNLFISVIAMSFR
jgi:hypothetical protein